MTVTPPATTSVLNISRTTSDSTCGSSRLLHRVAISLTNKSHPEAPKTPIRITNVSRISILSCGFSVMLRSVLVQLGLMSPAGGVVSFPSRYAFIAIIFFENCPTAAMGPGICAAGHHHHLGDSGGPPPRSFRKRGLANSRNPRCPRLHQNPLLSSEIWIKGQDLCDGRDDGCGCVYVFGDGVDLCLYIREGKVDGFDLGREIHEERGIRCQLLLIYGGQNVADGLLSSVNKVLAMKIRCVPVGPPQGVIGSLIGGTGVWILKNGRSCGTHGHPPDKKVSCIL